MIDSIYGGGKVCPDSPTACLVGDYDAVDPERFLVGPPTFGCEKCDYPYMQPEQYEARVLGFGLYEDLDYTIKSKSKAED